MEWWLICLGVSFVVGILFFVLLRFGPPDVKRLEMTRNVTGLIKALAYQKDAQIRHNAALVLGRIGDTQAVEPLIAALQDPEADVRIGATWALDAIPDQRAVEPLIAALKDTDQVVRKNAAFALGKIGDIQALEPLIAALEDPEADVRIGAAWALYHIPDQRAVETLIAALKDTDQVVRQNAAWALKSIQDPRALKPLIAALSDDFEMVRRNAASALCYIPDQRAVEPLIAALKDTDQVVRQNAVWALKAIQDPRAIESFIAALSDSFEIVRLNAATALCEVHDERAIVPLASVATTDSSSDVRKTAGEALGKIFETHEMSELAFETGVSEPWGFPSYEQVITALNDGPSGELALSVMGVMQGSDTVEQLVTVICEYEENIRHYPSKINEMKVARARYEAISELERRQIEDPKVVDAATRLVDGIGKLSTEPLVKALLSSPSEHRDIVLGALDRLNWQPSKDEAGACFLVFKGRCEECVEIGAPAVEALVRALGSASPEVVSSAITALGEIGDARAVEPLIAALKDADVCQAAAVALGRCAWQPDTSETGAAYWIAKREWDKCVELGGSAVGPLIAALGDRDSTVCEAAIETLVKLGTPAVESLRTATLSSSDRAVRRAAASALERLGTPVPKPLSATEEAQALSVLRRLCDAYATNDKAKIAKLEPLAREIGEEADWRGGLEEMQRLFRKLGGRRGSRTLEMHWGGIGDWWG